MTTEVFYKLLAIFLTVGLGYFAGRLKWLAAQAQAGDAVQLLSNAAFTIFVPALLFRTTARLDLTQLPWRTVAAFFLPVLLLLFAVHGWQRRRAGAAQRAAAAPAVRAISATFGNSVQVGIPLAAALFGEVGLGIHIALISLHALVLLTVLTALVELDLARAKARHAGQASTWATLRQTLRNTLIHPVVLPVLAGMLWQLTGLGLHPVLDEALQVLSAAVVPICLVLIGLTLSHYGLGGHWRGALASVVLKLLVMPGLVLLAAHFGFGLSDVPLAVVVMMAAMPVGSNALIFSQRYETLLPETTAAIVLSTFAFAATASLWLGVLAWMAT